jgi:hypothetical protein
MVHLLLHVLTVLRYELLYEQVLLAKLHVAVCKRMLKSAAGINKQLMATACERLKSVHQRLC